MVREIPEDAYVLTPCGRLGGRTALSVSGEFIGEFEDTGAALAAVRERMEREQYWPDVAWVSDHGNWWLIDLDGNEIEDGDGDEDGYGDEWFCRCGEPFDKDCHGRARCPACDEPCPCCSDQ